MTSRHASPPDALWCPKCEEHTALTDHGICPWCDGPLQRRRGGWKRPDLAGRSRLNEPQLRALYQVYIDRGASINHLAKQIHLKVGYKSHHSAAVAISEGWKRLGLPARARLDAVRMACTVHGMAPKHGPRPGYGTYRRRLHTPDQPICAAVKGQPPGKGNPCKRPAITGSEYCHAHDPDRELERQFAVASMRSRLTRPDMVPMAPFATWLQDLHSAHGSFGRVAELIGMHRSQCYRFAKGQDTAGRPKDTISAQLAERSAMAAGSTLDAIYAPRAAAVTPEGDA